LIVPNRNGASTVYLSPLRAAALAKNFRGRARAAFTAGDYPHAAVLYRMAARTQAHAVTDDFGRVA
jgi:hypothetical protein